MPSFTDDELMNMVGGGEGATSSDASASLDVRLSAPVINAPSASPQSLDADFPPPRPVIPNRNCADDEKCKAYIASEIVPVIEWTRRNRVNLDEEWKEIIRMEQMIHDNGRRYFGRSDPYMPAFAQVLDARQSALTRALFPSDEYFDVQDAGALLDIEGDFLQNPPDPESPKRLKAYLKWELHTVGKIQNQMPTFLRQFEALGNSVLKVWYEPGQQRKGAPASSPLSTMRQSGARFSSRSMLYWYIYPLTAESIEDATMVFEDMDVSRGFIKSMGRPGPDGSPPWKNIDAALNAPVPAQHLSSQIDLITNVYGGTPPSLESLNRTDIGGVRTITEVYTFMPLPDTEYMPHEEKGSSLPVKLTMAGNIPVSITRNPFHHQLPPYIYVTKYRTTGFVYGNGVGRRAKPLQYLLNDFAGQTNDVGIYCLNPVSKINPSMVVGPIPKMAPGKAWLLTDIEAGHKFDRPPTDIAQIGLQFIQFYNGQVQDYSGAPPAVQGINAGKGARTATGAQVLQNNALTPIQIQANYLGEMFLIPTLEMVWRNAVQYRDKKVMATVAGASIQITPEDLAIDARFSLLTSEMVQSQSQRNMAATQFLEVVGRIMPMLAQQQVAVNLVPVLRKIWEGLGYRNFDEVIKQPNVQQALQQPMQPQPQSAPPGPPGTNEQPTSALEQIPGQGPTDMVQGEGNEMAEVRHNAAMLAAQAGKNKGA